MVLSFSIQGRMARTSQGTATTETGGQHQELRKKSLPLMTNGIINASMRKQQLCLREMRHDCRESTFKSRKDKAESMMESKEGRIRKGKEVIRPRELGSGNMELGQNSQEGGQGGGSSRRKGGSSARALTLARISQDLGLPSSSSLGSRANLGR